MFWVTCGGGTGFILLASILLIGLKTPESEVRVAIVGKYTELSDSYKSLNEALIHGGFANRVKVDIRFVESEILSKMV